jgi:hypothetical protein
MRNSGGYGLWQAGQTLARLWASLGFISLPFLLAEPLSICDCDCVGICQLMTVGLSVPDPGAFQAS